MADVRKFFDDVQLAAESGGRQHDSKGQPLVGRYRDGTTPKPSERAYGAGQMQIGTARETAKKHGIAWDEQKFLNDKNYNLTLADKHMGDLQAKYGDKTLARAAYHSGTSTVDKAVAKYGRAGFAQGLGPEGRNYIKMGGQYNSSRPGQGVASPETFLNGLESSLGPQTESSQNVASSAEAIFNSDQEFKNRSITQDNAIAEQGGALDVLTQATQAFHAVQTAGLEKQVADTRAISQEITSGTQELQKQVQPVMEARTRIANQMDQLAGMNPIEKGLRSIFDLNYDQKYLEKQLDTYDRTLKARADDFQYLNTLHDTALKEVERRYNLDTALPKLAMDQANEDLGLVGMRVQQTSGSLNSLMDMVRGQGQLIAAKATAREDMLGRLDAPTLAKGMAAAQASGGVTKIGGVEISYNELYERSQAKEAQLLNIEGNRMAIASGRMDMAEKYASNLARSLTREQTEAAIANGGVYNGPDGPIQLPNDVLTSTLQTHLQRGAMMAETAENTMPAGQALKVASDSLKSMTGLYERSKGLYGEADFKQSGALLSQGATAIRALSEATKTGQPPEVIMALTKNVAKSQEALQKYTDEVILRSVGGDQRGASYMKSFVYGTPMNQGTAVEAMGYFATKGNLPSGMAVSPEAKQVFQEAQRLVAEKRDSTKPKGGSWTDKEVMESVTSQLTSFAADTVGAARFNLVYNDLPTLAKQTGHPLGRIPTKDWRNALGLAADDAAKAVSVNIGATVQEVSQMSRTHKPIDDSPEAQAKYDAFQKASGLYNVAEYRALATYLDDAPQVIPGQRNSTVLLDYMDSPQLQNQMKGYTAARGGNSFADYIVNPLAVGSTESLMQRTASDFRVSRDDEYQRRRQLSRTMPAGTLMNPAKRATVILGAIPGVSGAGAKRLAPFVQKLAQPMMNGQAPGGISVNAQMKDQDAQIYEGLKSMKFDDPGMETLRKNAVAGWPSASTQSKGLIESIIETTSEFFDLDGK